MNTTLARLGILASVAIATTFSSCNIDCIRGEGNLVTEDRNPGAFNSIKLEIPANVVLTQGQELQTRVEAQQNLLPHIKTTINRDKLVISSDDCIGENKGITLYITIPDIEMLSVDGSGDIKSTSTLNTSKLELVINGSGNISLDANAELIYCGIKGSGNVLLKGSSKQQYIKIDGSGDYIAVDFPTENTEVYINGSGNADVFAISKLKADISGSGGVRYKGNPDVKSRVTGSGDVTRL